MIASTTAGTIAITTEIWTSAGRTGHSNPTARTTVSNSSERLIRAGDHDGRVAPEAVKLPAVDGLIPMRLPAVLFAVLTPHAGSQFVKYFGSLPLVLFLGN